MPDMDLSCSESSADLSDFGSPHGAAPGDFGSFAPREYQALAPGEALEEVQRLVASEGRSAVPPGVLQAAGISPTEREGLVDLLFEVASSLDNFQFATIALAVNLLDRYVARSSGFAMMNGYLRKLVTVVCFSIACKVEEVYGPFKLPNHMELYNAAAHCAPREQPLGLDQLQLQQDLNSAEVAVLNALGWRALGVTAASLLDPLLRLVEPAWLAPADSDAGLDGHKALYVLENSCKEVLAKCLREAAFLDFAPSVLAVAAIRLALEGMGAAAGTDLLPAARALPLTEPVAKCRQLMKQLLGGVPVPTCSPCELEAERCAGGSVRVQRVGAGCVTPRSVLQPAPAAVAGGALQLHCFELLGEQELLASPAPC